jgi:coproporphyrinogen III oxidase-like Fe-S oxidoreductase
VTLSSSTNKILTRTSADKIDAPQAAYVHIPFCRRRCFYCDFPIAVAGDRARGETSPRMQTYVDALCREIQVTPALGQPLKTVFFGGGTPSLLAVAQVAQILTALSDRFGIESGAEISMEMDPGTFDRAALTGVAAVGGESGQSGGAVLYRCAVGGVRAHPSVSRRASGH